MRFLSVLIESLLVSGVIGARGRRLRRQLKPDNPTDPGITPDCSYYDTWVFADFDCLLWLEDWDITPQQFSQYVSTSSTFQLFLSVP